MWDHELKETRLNRQEAFALLEQGLGWEPGQPLSSPSWTAPRGAAGWELLGGGRALVTLLFL